MGGQQGKKRKGGNPGVGVDFKKVKHKVGKRLPKAQNETDTSFKARNINLPSQAVNQDKTGVATNYHNLTLKELLGQVSHYSDKTRKAALVGLGDLFAKHPEELTGHVGVVYSRLVERMADPEEPVRQGLQALLRERVCVQVSPRQLRPFMPMIMAHMYGAMTHLSLDVRNDALIFLDILMDHYAQLITSGYLAPCLSHFCDLLSSGHRSRSIRGQSLKSLSTILRALHDFLRRAFPATSLTTSTTTQLSTDSNNTTTSLPLLRHRCRWPAVPAPDSVSQPHLTTAPNTSNTPGKPKPPGSTTPSSSTPASEQGSAQATHQQSAPQAVAAVAHRLLRLLMECWPECAPTTLSISPTLDQSTALVLVLSCCRMLMENTLSTTLPSSPSSSVPPSTQKPLTPPTPSTLPDTVLQALLRNLTTNFPATMPAVRPSPPILEQMTNYNLSCAHVLVKLLPAAMQTMATQHGAAQDPMWVASETHAHPALPPWANGLVGFYINVLQTGKVVQGGGLMSGTQAGPTTTTTKPTLEQGASGAQGATKASLAPTGDAARMAGPVYLSVLAGVEDVVGLAPMQTAGRLLAAVDMLAGGCPSRSSLRASCLQLQHRLMKRWQDGDLFLDPSWVAAWLGALPRMLWELGGASPTISMLALSMLHDAARFCPATSDTTTTAGAAGAAGAEVPALPLHAALQQLQPQLAPLWAVQLPGRPARKQTPATSGQVVPGPVAQLPEHIQLLAIDTLYHLGPLHPSLMSAVLRVIHHQLLPSSCTLRLVEVCMWIASKSDPPTATSIILTLLFSPSPTPKAPADPAPSGSNSNPDVAATVQRQWQVATCTLRMARTIAPASILLQLLSSHLQPLLQPLLHDVTTSSIATDTILYVHCVLWLCGRGLEELAAGQQDVASLPAWLEQALPDLALWYCMHISDVPQHAGSTPAAGTGSWQAGSNSAAGELAGVPLVVRLCHPAPQHVIRLFNSALAVTDRFRTGTSAGQGQVGGSSQQYVAVMDLLCGLLGDKGLRQGVLTHASHVCGVVTRLVMADGLPGHVTAELSCMAMVQRLKHAADDLVGMGV